jgi:Anti-sigma-K factor rskA
MTHRPSFDELVGNDVPEEERQRLRAAHELLIAAGPPPELSPEMESVPWPEEALGPIWGKTKHASRRPVLVAAALATAVFVGFLLGQTTSSSPTSIDARQTLKMRGTGLDRDALATLELGRRDAQGNWPMVLHVRGLQQLPRGGYYDLYLTKAGKPIVSCGTFNVDGETVVRFTAAYNLEHFDRNGWVVVRKTPGHFEPTEIVLRPSV